MKSPKKRRQRSRKKKPFRMISRIQNSYESGLRKVEFEQESSADITGASLNKDMPNEIMLLPSLNVRRPVYRKRKD